ncbi:sulfotransferase [Aquisalimonas sp.]|uniref:sulfotransferase family protein n=1 Tax=Aquisalimonas sp. TaxID=1872621 RepID=UPI0025BB46B3|nr:sulfotransferase [Aquisalimonas sp.]
MSVLLVGLPRSGTTWVGKILDSHPQTLYRHEPDRGGALRDVPIHAPPDATDSYGARIESFLQALPASRDARVCGKLPLFPKRYLPGWRFTAFKTSIYLDKATRGRLPIPITQPVSRINGAPVTVWKSIESTGRAGLIARCASELRVIHLLRHPCGQIASILRGEASGHFSDDCPSSEDWHLFAMLCDTPQAQRHNLDLERLRAMDPVSRLAWRWVLFNEKAMDELDGLENACTVCYEDVCLEPEAIARRMIDFAGMEWDPAVEVFLGESASSGTDAYYSVYRNAAREVDRWRERLEPEQIERIGRVVEDTVPGALYRESFHG